MKLEHEEELCGKKKHFNRTSSSRSSRNVGHSLLLSTAGIWLWCAYDVRVERERRSNTGTVTTLITLLKCCWESRRFSYTPITWLSCMDIMNHRTDHDPLMKTMNYWQGGPGCFLIPAMRNRLKPFLPFTDVICKVKWSTWNYAFIVDITAGWWAMMMIQ